MQKPKNMTPKEKAMELYDKYFFPHYKWVNDGYQVDEKLTYELRKKFALIAVDEILGFLSYQSHIRYWQEVKQEIEKL